MDKFNFILSAHGLEHVYDINSNSFTIPTGNLIAASHIEPRLLPKLFIHLPVSLRNGILSDLGTPVFDQVFLQTASDSITGDFAQIVFDAVLIDVTQTKNIVKTVVQGRKGTVKEYINEGDYIVKLRGVITGFGKDYYPSEKISEFKKIWTEGSEIDIVSEYLQMLGIYKVVIETFSLSQKQGFMDTIIFELTCCSDLPFELQETNA